jgi:hypothetical protein
MASSICLAERKNSNITICIQRFRTDVSSAGPPCSLFHARFTRPSGSSGAVQPSACHRCPLFQAHTQVCLRGPGTWRTRSWRGERRARQSRAGSVCSGNSARTSAGPESDGKRIRMRIRRQEVVQFWRKTCVACVSRARRLSSGPGSSGPSRLQRMLGPCE